MSRVWILLLLTLWPATAQAGPVVAAISAIASAFAGSVALMTLGRVLLSVAIAAYQRRRMKKAMERQSGIKTQYTSIGGTTPLTVIVGRYATAGHLDAPQNSQPANSDPPQKYLTYVINLSDMPITGLTGRVVINDTWHTLLPVDAEDAGDTGSGGSGGGFIVFPDPSAGFELYGQTVEGELQNVAWFRVNDGTQTVADPFLIEKFGSDSERPWTADMIGTGLAYVVATFARDQEKLPGEPRLRFEVLGLKLYDPRKDSTVGGVGAHRWAVPATWEYTANPKVIEYNIHRGLRIDGYGVWGGNASAEALPLDNWFAAMNACDVLVDDGDGGVEPAFEFGFEFSLDQEPAEIIDEINLSCLGDTVEIAGVYKTRVGAVGLPVYFFDDGDIIVTRPQELDPFPSLDQTFNALTCSFPDPNILWEAREAPPLTNDTWEAQDGLIAWDHDLATFVTQPRRLLREISLPGVENLRQVQRVMSAEAIKSRRRKSHGLSLPPSALVLEPLDTVAWTSAHNGYANKIFEIVMVADPVQELRPRVGLLEADPDEDTAPDYVPLPAPSTRDVVAVTVTVAGFGAAPFSIIDSASVARRPGARLTWAGQTMADVRGIAYEVRVAATGAMGAQGTVQTPETGEVLVGGLLPATDYEARARAISNRATVWTDWIPFTTADLKISRADLVQGAVVRSLGPSDWVTLPGGGLTITKGSAVTNLVGATIIDNSLPAGAQQIFAAARITLGAAVDRWVVLRVRLSWLGGFADFEQMTLLPPGASERSFAAPAEATDAITGISLSIRPLSLESGEAALITQARCRVYSIYR